MKFPTVDPESDWTPEQTADGCRIVGARVDAVRRNIVWLDLQFHEDAGHVVVETNATFADSDAV